jgi:hypothetical protein
VISNLLTVADVMTTDVVCVPAEMRHATPQLPSDAVGQRFSPLLARR